MGEGGGGGAGRRSTTSGRYAVDTLVTWSVGENAALSGRPQSQSRDVSWTLAASEEGHVTGKGQP